MKKATLAFVLVALAASPAAQAEELFRGTFVVTAASNCSFSAVGNEGASYFHPRVAGNADFNGLSFVYPWGLSVGYGLDGLDFTSAYQPVSGTIVGDWGNGYTYSGAQILVTARTPGTISATTRFVTIKGKVKNHKDDPGVGGNPCVVTFEASYTRND